MKNKAFIMIIIAGILWGTSGIFVHILAPFGISSMQMTFIRSIVTFFVLAIYIFIKDKKIFHVKKSELLLFFASGISFFFTASCYFISMQKTSVATAVVLMYIAPVIVMIYSVLFLGEKLTPLKIISVVSMLLGCFLVSGIIGGLKFDLLGIIIGICSGLTYSAYNIFTKIQMRRGSHPQSATFYCFVFASIISAFVSEPLKLASTISVNPLALSLLFIALGIFTCVLPYFLYTISLKYLPVGTAAALGIVEPMSATAFSILLLGESPDITAYIGIILILGAVFLLSRTNE